jgi:drug/metabolite transporter (DMT)-like permease
MTPTHPYAGPLLMVLSTGSYVVNDTMMKLATEGLPPYETLTLRGIAAVLWGLPLLLALGYRRQMGMMFERRVLARNLCETGGILCYVVALANMPIADVVALGQITPLLVILGAAFLFDERVGPLRMALIGVGFVGALMVAQPGGGGGISVYALLALGNAVFCAARDLAGRRVPAVVPGLVVALSAAVVVLVGALVAHLLTEEWVVPSARGLLLLLAAGLFLMGGHFCVFMAYRIGPTRTVAPFFYAFTLWAVIAGVVVFGALPNALALAGIAIVTVSGLAVVMLDGRRRPLPAA